MYDENVPVLIVGGGSVGLSAAVFLSRLGVRPLLIERHASTSNHPRARGLNYRTMEIFRSVGLEESIRSAGAALANVKLSLLVETLAGKELRRFGSFEDAENLAKLEQLTPVTWCFCAQDQLEPLLLATAAAQGAEIRFATELLSFAQDETGVTAILLDRATNTQRTIRTDYLLAADGARSPIRQALGIGESGRGTIGHYFSIYFRSDLHELIAGREFAMCFVKNPAAPGTLSSVNNKDRWVFNVEYDPVQGESAADFTPERCVELVRTMVGWPELEVELLSTQSWEAAVKIADSYQSGRIFLAGDAVHVMPPAGAFGMNTGIQDVHNLAWKLAYVLNKQSSPSRLDTYELERRPVGAITVEQAALRLDFRGGGRPAEPDADKPKLIDDLTMILGYNYQAKTENGLTVNPAIPNELNPDGQPGTRAPHLWLEQAGKRISTLDLFGKNFVLLASTEGVVWQAAARKIAESLNIPVDVYNIGEAASLTDPANHWLDAFGVSAEGAVLVRPDGFVAWRSTGKNDEAAKSLEEVFKGFF